MLAKARGKLSSPAAVRFDEGSPELQAQAAALGRCAAQPAYRVGFEAFFGTVAPNSNLTLTLTITLTLT